MQKLFQGGPVIVDNALCIGCRSCVLTCPYGVPEAYLQGEQITKCDQCVHRLAEGRIPACTEACPTGALEFVVSVDTTAPKEYRPWRNL
jgi:Fe-S-cluster-containing dehydrogenase component